MNKQIPVGWRELGMFDKVTLSCRVTWNDNFRLFDMSAITCWNDPAAMVGGQPSEFLGDIGKQYVKVRGRKTDTFNYTWIKPITQ